MKNLDKIRELKQTIEDHQAKFVDLLKPTLLKLFGELDEEIESFGWYQYSNFFNDGDSCPFWVRTDSEQILLNGESAYDLEGEKYEKASTIISDFLCEIGDDILENVFGDHAEVIVYRDRVEVSEYTDHE